MHLGDIHIYVYTDIATVTVTLYIYSLLHSEENSNNVLLVHFNNSIFLFYILIFFTFTNLAFLL